jgi:hypothetical protein
MYVKLYESEQEFAVTDGRYCTRIRSEAVCQTILRLSRSKPLCCRSAIAAYDLYGLVGNR